jgi:hypothetical protein
MTGAANPDLWLDVGHKEVARRRHRSQKRIMLTTSPPDENSGVLTKHYHDYGTAARRATSFAGAVFCVVPRILAFARVSAGRAWGWEFEHLRGRMQHPALN